MSITDTPKIPDDMRISRDLKILELSMEGLNHTQISALLGISSQRVGQILMRIHKHYEQEQRSTLWRLSKRLEECILNFYNIKLHELTDAVILQSYQDKELIGQAQPLGMKGASELKDVINAMKSADKKAPRNKLLTSQIVLEKYTEALDYYEARNNQK